MKELIDIKVTALFAALLIAFKTLQLHSIIEIIIGIVVLGYHLDRWRIMRHNHKNNKQP